MKQYDSIQYYGDNWGLPIIAFDKLDGSNLRFEYSHKRGFYKFGTRNMMIDRSHEQFGFAVDLFLNKYYEKLRSVFREEEYRNTLSFVCFAELVGSRSAFGQHDFDNDQFDTILFDISEYKKGFIPPKRFSRDFSHCGLPRIIYEGNLNREFVSQVRSNAFELKEGVICKGVTQSRKGNDGLFYCKIKTDDWFRRLRELSIEDYEREIKEIKTQ